MSDDLVTAPDIGASDGLRMELAGVTRTFGETQALRGVDLVIRSGEILGIAGPNGAGKSTLIRILAGEETRDDGTILVNGEPWMTGDAQDRVAVVHQEPQLWPNLSVAQNMVVGREPDGVRFPDLPPTDRALLHQLEIEQYADVALADCPLAVRQRVEIGRALAREARFFLFDEPNSALTEEESDRLFAWMHQLAGRGRIVMLVSHRLGELVAHCDRVAVIRDGVVAAELERPSITEAAIARELVLGYLAVGTSDGQADPGYRQPRPRIVPSDGAVLVVEGWTSSDGTFRDVTLRVGRGEIVALVGVEGSGARELVSSIAGFHAAAGTAVLEDDRDRGALRTHSAYLPADRRGMLFYNLSVGDNLVVRLGSPEIAGLGGFLRPGRLATVAERLVERFRVRTSSPRAPLPSLSGGNQQKVAIAASIAGRPSLLVLEEPTRGVDVGSKAEIYRILRDYAREGHGVLLFCTEIPEVYELADTVLVVDEGEPGRPMRVADFPDLPSLADAIASSERTIVQPQDLARSLAQAVPDPATGPREDEG